MANMPRGPGEKSSTAGKCGYDQPWLSHSFSKRDSYKHSEAGQTAMLDNSYTQSLACDMRGRQVTQDLSGRGTPRKSIDHPDTSVR